MGLPLIDSKLNNKQVQCLSMSTSPRLRVYLRWIGQLRQNLLQNMRRRTAYHQVTQARDLWYLGDYLDWLCIPPQTSLPAGEHIHPG